MKRQANLFILKIIVVILLYVLAITLINSSHIAVIFSGAVLVGLINAHSIQLLHQCSHRSAFRKKALNDAAGFILGLFTLIRFKEYQKKHFAHHRDLGTTKNKEYFHFQNYDASSTLFKKLMLIFGINHVSVKRLFQENRQHLLSLQNFIYMALLFIFPLFSIGWITANLIITKPITFLIEIPEHYGCNRLSSDKNLNTRTILHVNKLVSWYTNWNHFHSEHHRHPNIKPEELASYITHKSPGISCMNTYSEFFRFYFSTHRKAA